MWLQHALAWERAKAAYAAVVNRNAELEKELAEVKAHLAEIRAVLAIARARAAERELQRREHSENLPSREAYRAR